jgi:hypothetical protein
MVLRFAAFRDQASFGNRRTIFPFSRTALISLKSHQRLIDSNHGMAEWSR